MSISEDVTYKMLPLGLIEPGSRIISPTGEVVEVFVRDEQDGLYLGWTAADGTRQEVGPHLGDGSPTFVVVFESDAG